MLQKKKWGKKSDKEYLESMIHNKLNFLTNRRFKEEDIVNEIVELVFSID